MLKPKQIREPKGWQIELVEIKIPYVKCSYCGFSFKLENRGVLPYYCGGCGADRRGNEK